MALLWETAILRCPRGNEHIERTLDARRNNLRRELGLLRKDRPSAFPFLEADSREGGEAEQKDGSGSSARGLHEHKTIDRIAFCIAFNNLGTRTAS